MKQKLLLKTMLLLCALIVGGASSVWADVYSYTFNASSGISKGDNTLSGVTWNITHDSQYNANEAAGYHVGSGSKSVSYLQLSTSGISGTISKIVANAKGNGSGGTISVTVNGNAYSAKNNDNAITSSSKNFEFTGSSTGSIVIRLAYSSALKNNLYISSVDVTYSASSGEETTTTIDASGITNTNKFVSTVAGFLSAIVKDESDDEIDGATITWSGDNAAVATINASTGAVTLVGAGTVTFTATYAGVEDEYSSSTDTYEMTVTNEDPSLVTIWSENFSTYSADNVPSGGTYGYACTDGGGTTKIYAQNNAGGTSPELLIGKTNGTFSATVTLLHSTYGYSGDLTLKFKSNAYSINVNTTTDGITVDGEATEGAGLTFTTKDTHTVTFKGVTTATENITIVFKATTSSNVRLDDIVLKGKQAALSVVATPSISPASGAVASGTEVTMTCATDGATIYYTTDGATPTSSSTAYNPASKPTITSACTIKAIGIKDGLTNSAVASADYTIATPCATPTFSVAEGEVAKGTTVTISCATDGATIYYTTNGTTPTTSSSVYSGAITINTTQTIKAIAAKVGNANSEVASATYTVIDYVTLPYTWAGGTSTSLAAETGVTASGLSSDYGSTHAPYYLKMDGVGDYIQIKTNAQPVKVLIGIKMVGGASTSKIKVQESADGTSFTDVEELTISGAQNDIVNLTTTSSFATSTRYVKIIKSVHGSNIGVGPIMITDFDGFDVKLNTSGYATFASTYALDFSDDSEFSAWQITGIDGENITFSQIKGTVAAGTGVFLKGTASETINIPVSLSGSSISGTNKLAGITSATAVDNNEYYGLSGNVFKKVNAGTVPAGKALLPASAITGSARELKFVFEGSETTGISDASRLKDNGEMRNDNFFNLKGQRVAQPTKGGLYIVNGKKVVIK